MLFFFFFFSSRRRHTRLVSDWSSDVCSSDLTFMIGGDKEVYEKTKPYLENMGKQFFYCGGAGMGLNAKLTQNLILSNILRSEERRVGKECRSRWSTYD